MSKADFIKNAEKQLREAKRAVNQAKKALRDAKRDVRGLNKQLTPVYQKKLKNIKRRIYRNNYVKKHSSVSITYEVKINLYIDQMLDRTRTTEFVVYHQALENRTIDDFFEGDQQKCEDLYNSNEVVKEFKYKSHYIISKKEFDKHFKPATERTLKAISPYIYKHTLVDDLNIPDKDGECVQNALVRIYKKYIPTLTIDKVDAILKEGCSVRCKEQHEGHTFEHIIHFCNVYKITHYCLDIKNKLVSKHVVHPSDKTPFIGYIIGNHLYTVQDPVVKRRIAKVHADSNSAPLQSDVIEEKVNTCENYFNLEKEEISKIKDANVYLNKENIKDLLKEYFMDTMTGYKNALHDGKVTRIKLDNNVTVHNNPNYTHGLEVTDMINLCKLFNVEFKNQSLTSFMWNLYDMFTAKKPATTRINLSHLLKQQILNEQSNLCNECLAELKKYEIDHIVPLSDGGDNSRANLQALCSECHEVKSHKEDIDRFFKIDSMKSSFNHLTKPIFTKAKNAFISGSFTDEYDQELLGGVDINKCRRNIVKYSSFDYCVYSSLDEPKIYNGEPLDTGFYFIETRNHMPFKGNGWYSFPLVQFALQKSIITNSNIKYVLRPSSVLKYNHFNKFFDFVLSTLQPHQNDQKMAIITKRAFNCFIGALGSKVSKSGTITFTTDIEEASYNAIKYNDMVYKIDEKDGKEYYEIKNYMKEYKNDNSVPIFNQILDLEAIELYKACEVVQSVNVCELLYLNTDQVVVLFKDKKDIQKVKDLCNDHFWDTDMPKYKFENKIKHKNEILPVISDEVYQLDESSWKEHADSGSNDFVSLAKYLIDNVGSFNLDGRAGCGKSTLIKAIIKVLEERKINYQGLAPTNKACNIINGITLHKFFTKLKNNPNKATIKSIIGSLKYIIIDEISMVKEIFYRFFYFIHSNHPEVKWIIAGDFKQLPPVCDIAHFDYRNSSILKEICGYNRVNLTKCRRADTEFFKECMDPNQIDLTTYSKKQTYLNICYHNSLRKKINELCMQRWMKQYKITKCVLVKKCEKAEQSQDTYVYKNLPLIGSIGCAKYGIVNCESYFVKEFGEDESIIKETDGDNEFSIPNEEITKYFNPRYCISFHKAQGATFNDPYTIHEWDTLNETLKYVALSRATAKKFVNIV